ncbi:MAG TPA: hypothetical protein VFU05_17975 [Cyclobacteriaceae bacterium]|nr:hypothetical protein [Cyclobacteriaceae bacterium]
MRTSIQSILIVGLTFIAASALAQRRSTITIRPIDKADTLAKFLDVIDLRETSQERDKHRIIWQRVDVRTIAIKYAANGGVVYTMTDDGTNLRRGKIVIGLYLLDEGLERKLGTFKVNKTGQVSGKLTVDN